MPGMAANDAANPALHFPWRWPGTPHRSPRVPGVPIKNDREPGATNATVDPQCFWLRVVSVTVGSKAGKRNA